MYSYGALGPCVFSYGALGSCVFSGGTQGSCMISFGTLQVGLLSLFPCVGESRSLGVCQVFVGLRTQRP